MPYIWQSMREERCRMIPAVDEGGVLYWKDGTVRILPRGNRSHRISSSGPRCHRRHSTQPSGLVFGEKQKQVQMTNFDAKDDDCWCTNHGMIFGGNPAFLRGSCLGKLCRLNRCSPSRPTCDREACGRRINFR